MVPARRITGLGRTATVKGAGRGDLLMESENPSTASPIKQLPVNVIPTDWLTPDTSNIVPPYQVLPVTDVPLDLSTQGNGIPAQPIDKFTTPPQYLLASVSPTGGRASQTPIRASTGNGTSSPDLPPATTVYGKVVYPAPPPTPGTVPAPVTVLPNQPVTTTVTQPPPGTVTSTGNPAPATVTTTPTGLVPTAVTPPAGTVSLFGYNIPTTYLLIGGALLVLWLMDTHKSPGGRR